MNCLREKFFITSVGERRLVEKADLRLGFLPWQQRYEVVRNLTFGKQSGLM